jgi:anaerobic selenocysteine-containing dehydrogenase
MMNPEDAQRCGFVNGERVKVASRVGEISAPLEVTDQVMTGVISMPFGWGHNREGVKLSVAKEHPGVSMNDVTDDSLYDKVCGISVLDGIPVTVTKVD